MPFSCISSVLLIILVGSSLLGTALPPAQRLLQDFTFLGILAPWSLTQFTSWVTQMVGSSIVLDGITAGELLLTHSWRRLKNGGVIMMNTIFL